MSTVSKVNFEPKSDILKEHQKDFSLADGNLATPDNAVCAIDGEWFIPDTTGKKIVRATDVTSVGDEPDDYLLMPCWSERGRTDVQAMSRRALTMIFMGEYEFDTRIFNAAVAVGTGAAITLVGQPLKVATITIGSRNYSGLVGAVFNEAAPAKFVGYVTRLPAANNGKLRFRTGWRR
jgi:hypothetical protein